MSCRGRGGVTRRNTSSSHGGIADQLSMEDFMKNMVQSVDSINFSTNKLKRHSYVIDHRPGM